MKRLFYLLLSVFLVSSCGNTTQRDNEKDILGDWIRVKPRMKPNSIINAFVEGFNGNTFCFYPNHKFDSKLGYYGNSADYSSMNTNGDKPDKEAMVYLGSLSKFSVTTDTLKIYNLNSKNWNSYKINKLTKDSLCLKIGDVACTYTHYKSKQNNDPKIDEIVLSTSGCFGTCPISSTLIKSNGEVLFDGEGYTTLKELFTGHISTTRFQNLADNFKKVDFDSLQTNYQAGWTDDETITTTFLKNGRISKTILDYGRQAPPLFTVAYNPLRYLYQTITMLKMNYPEFLSKGRFLLNAELIKGDSVLALKQSESFLLFDYLRLGKLVDHDTKSRFNLRIHTRMDPPAPAKTDGRYFTFLLKRKFVTIDIGFNFYDINNKHWQWRKTTKYD